VAEVEHVVEQEDRALGRTEPLEHHEDGHGELFQLVQAGQSVLVQVDGLRQPIAAALLPARPGRGELVQAQARHHRHQERLRRLDVSVTPMPAQPGFLDDVLGASDVAEHAIGEPHQRRPVGLEHREIFRRS
jgi:hypothetical protein